MQKSYFKCLYQLYEFKEILSSENNTKLGKLFFSWIETKTNIVKNEKSQKYLYNNLTNFTLPNYPINLYLFNKSTKTIQNIIKDNYAFIDNKYIFKNKNISYENALLIANFIIFKRGNVVWIDFGFNIGNEFGGMHPAIILKNFKTDLFVLPLSSKKPKEYIKIEQDLSINDIEIAKNNITEIIQFDNIYGFKNITRWANLTRMKKVSVLRINFSGSIGTISGFDLNRISERIKKEF